MPFASLELSPVPASAAPAPPTEEGAVGLQRLFWAVLAAGAATRILRWALGWPLWSDEAFLAASLLDRGYADLFRPLEYHQVCPPLFLCLQLTVVRLLGFSEYTLRLVPLACSLGSLALFGVLARQALRGHAAILATAIFAASYPAIRYTAEAKPYSCDLLVSMLLIACFVHWVKRPNRGRLAVLAAALPLGMAFSYPAVFTAGGISVAAGLVLLRPRLRSWSALAGWLGLNGVIAAGFAVVWFYCIRPQSAADLGEMQLYWAFSFPPLERPLALVGWFVSVHTGELLAHPFGGPRGGSLLTFALCLAAVVTFVRRRRWWWLALVFVPLALNLTAAVLHRFPYGGHVRMALYLSTVVCLLAGFGLARLECWWWPAAAQRGHAARVTLAMLLALLAGTLLRTFTTSGKTQSDVRARDFARWFWEEMGRDGELVCLKTDLGQSFTPLLFQRGYSALYLCNQRIYSPRHARGESPRWHRVSRDWPLRYVVYHCSQHPQPRDAVAQWMTSRTAGYRLVRRLQYPLTHESKPGVVDATSGVELWEYVPR